LPSLVTAKIVFFSFQIYSSYIFIERINIVRNLEGRFEEAVIAYLFIVNLLPIILVPLMWAECGKVARILNSWGHFEVCIREGT
jgi:gustatory receptor